MVLPVGWYYYWGFLNPVNPKGEPLSQDSVYYLYDLTVILQD